MFIVRLKIFILLCLLFASINCSTSTFTWKQTLYSRSELPYVFDKTNIVGTGFKITDTGYYPKTCLKKIESDISGGKLDIEFIKIFDYKSDTNLPLDHFINKSIERANKFNISNTGIESFLLSIKIKDRISAIREDSIEFRDDVKEILRQSDTEKFFRTCGTDFIRSVIFDSEIYLFISFYPKSSEEVKKIHVAISKRINNNKNDILQIRLFDDLDFYPDVYFSLQTNAGKLFDPTEFFFKGHRGNKIDVFLNKLLGSIINSDRGRTKNFNLSPWSNLDQALILYQNKKDTDIIKYSPEAIFKSLQLLENSVRQFELKQEQFKKILTHNKNKSNPGFRDCCNAMTEIAKDLNWEAYYNCKAQAEANNTVNLEILPVCQSITKRIKELNSYSKCLIFDNIKIPVTELINDKIYLPVELGDRDIKDPVSIYQKESDYRFTDKEQLENLPPNVKVGQGMDINTGKNTDNCIIEKTKKLSSSLFRDTSITNDYYPHSFRQWSLMKRAALFWKDSPKRVLYRGSFEIQGYSNKLLPDFEISEDAKKLASKNISAFYKKYGTHYVSQIQHRRGFVYYFSLDSPDDKDIEIKPYGMPEPKPIAPVPADISSEIKDMKDMPGFEDSGCCLIPKLDIFKTFDIFGSGPKPPEIIKPKTVKEFFNNKEKIIKLFESDEEAIPVRLSLEPWSEYLLDRGILKPHQLNLK